MQPLQITLRCVCILYKKPVTIHMKKKHSNRPIFSVTSHFYKIRTVNP